MFGSRRLKSLSIRTPCRESWADMSGAGSTRFCESCNQTVHDLASLTRREAAKLVQRSDGRLCGRIIHDRRGQIVFRNEPKTASRLVGISLLGVFASFAQAPDKAKTCSVEVRVTDPGKERVPHATVSVTQKQDPETEQYGTADASGVFRDDLSTGHYQLQVAAYGFKSYEQTDLNVSCNSETPITMDVQLEVGNVFMGEMVMSASYRGPLQKAWFKTKSAFRRALSFR